MTEKRRGSRLLFVFHKTLDFHNRLGEVIKKPFVEVVVVEILPFSELPALLLGNALSQLFLGYGDGVFLSIL